MLRSLPLLLLLCGAAAAMPGGVQPARDTAPDRVAHIDSLRDSSGGMHYRVRCTDITVRLHNDHWVTRDSVLFFRERRKVEWASKVLQTEVQLLQDSLQHLTGSAGTLIDRGAFTRATLDSAVTTLQDQLQRTIITHKVSLRRLEDYQSVLDAVDPLLRRGAHQ